MIGPRRLVGLGLLGGLAFATTPGASGQVNLDRSHAGAGPNGYVTVEEPGVGPLGQLQVALELDLSHAPLVVRDPAQGDVVMNGQVIRDRLALRTAFAYAPSRRVELGVGWATAIQHGDAAPGRAALTSAAIGDVWLRGKLALSTRRDLGIAVALELTVPTGSVAAYLGESGVTIAPSLIVGARRGPATVAAQLGYRLRGRSAVLDLEVDDEVVAGVAARVALGASPVWLETELAGRIGLQGKGNSSERPLELITGVGTRLVDRFSVRLAGGLGLGDGYGAPVARGLITLRFAPRASSPAAPPRVATWSPPVDDDPMPAAAVVRAPPPPDPAPELELVGDRIVIPERVLFDVGSAALKDSAVAQLAQVVARWGAEPSWDRVVVVGHTDLRGTPADNLALSQRRAEAVRAALVGLGAEPARVEAIGLGEREPVASGTTARDHVSNRRVELVIVRTAVAP